MINKVKIEFIELEIDWPSEISVFNLRNYILSKLNEYGEPLRWAITSVSAYSEKKIQTISVEVVLIMNKDNGIGVIPDLNSL